MQHTQHNTTPGHTPISRGSRWLALLLCLMLPTTPVLAGEITYYYPDATGSPVAATDAQGNILWREHYQPYGEKLNEPCPAPCNTPADYEDVGYTGHEYDAETGLTYMQARYYDPEVGRFLAIDPVGFKPGQPMTFNRYSYANNNPYKFVDPDGENLVFFQIATSPNSVALSKQHVNAARARHIMRHNPYANPGYPAYACGTSYSCRQVALSDTALALTVLGLTVPPTAEYALPAAAIVGGLAYLDTLIFGNPTLSDHIEAAISITPAGKVAKGFGVGDALMLEAISGGKNAVDLGIGAKNSIEAHQQASESTSIDNKTNMSIRQNEMVPACVSGAAGCF